MAPRTNISKDYEFKKNVTVEGALTVVGSIIGGGGTRDWKDNVDTVATSNITLSGEQTINGFATSNSRVAPVGQSDSSENGIYITDAGAWTRAEDADEDAEVTNGMAFVVSGAGSTKVEFRYILTTADPITIGVTDLTFAEHPPGLVDVIDDLTPELGGPLDSKEQSINWSKGSPVASAATADIWATDGNTLHVTGTVTITSLGTAPRIGAWRRLIFDDVLLLTDGANLNLPGGADITTAIDDMAFVYAETTTLFKVLYFRADGTAVVVSPGGINNVVEDTTPQYGGVMDTNQFQHRLSKGADIVSAATLTPGTDGNYFDVTGTTTITAIASLAVGTVIRLHFDAALILTHDAADLVLPTGANITTVADDEATFVQYAAGDWRCTEYQRADGTALAGSAGAGDSIKVSINQTAHGRSVEEWVRHNGTLYVLSIADNGENAEVYGVITEITDVDNFVITIGGRATLSGLTAGLPHFLSDSVAGALTTIKPAISKPLFFADSTTTGFVINMRAFQSGLGGGGGGGAWTKILSQSASSSAQIDFTSDIDSTFGIYFLFWRYITPQTNSANLRLRVSNASTFKTDNNYEYHTTTVFQNTTNYGSTVNAADTSFLISVGGLGNAAGKGASGFLILFDPANTTENKQIWVGHNGQGTDPNFLCGGGFHIGMYAGTITAVDGLRFFMDTGNMVTGDFTLYGLST